MDRPAEHTVFSLSDQVPDPLVAGAAPVAGADERILARGAVGELCSVRKLSRRGAVLHLETPVEVGQHLSFELVNGRTIAGTVSWVSGTEVILRFAADLDVIGVIASELVAQPGERRRMPRIEVQTPAKLQIGPRLIHGLTHDLSQGGIKLAVREKLEVGTRLDVSLTGFRALPSEVRWTEEGFAGLHFVEELPWQEMMPWLRELMRNVAAAPLVHAPAPLPVEAAASSVELNIPARIREGAARWNVAVVAITTHEVTFESYARPRFGTLLAVTLPGLEGWAGRVIKVEGDRWTCEFAQPLHPAVVERMLAGAR